MKVKTLAAVLLLALGVGAAAAIADTTGTASVCATATAPKVTVVAPATTAVYGGDTQTSCTTVTYTEPTATVTVTQPASTPTTPGTTTTTTAPSPPTGSTPGIGYLDESGHLTNVANPSIYSMMIGGPWGSDVSVLKGIPGRGLVYFDGTDVQTSYSTGVPYSQASANGWLLKDSAGNLLKNTTYGSYCADVGSAGYQRAWISNVESYLASHAGVDGVFIDNVLFDPKGDCGAYPSKYPTTASWDTAMVSFVSAVYSALHAKGYYVAENVGAYKSGDSTFNDGSSTVAWWQTIAPHTDGLTNEFYDETSTNLQLRTTGTAWYQQFDGWQRLIGIAQADGDDFIGLMYGAAGDTTAMTYGKASFLLEWNGGGSAFIYKIKGSTADATDPSWTKDIGQPTAAKVAVGAGYKRSYTGGTVLLNPSPTSSQTFTVNGTSYTLAPTTARIVSS